MATAGLSQPCTSGEVTTPTEQCVCPGLVMGTQRLAAWPLSQRILGTSGQWPVRTKAPARCSDVEGLYAHGMRILERVSQCWA